MNRYDAVRMGAAYPVTFPTTQVKETQNDLVMSFEIFARITDVLDQPYYLDDESPIQYKSERLDDTYMIEWHEWKSTKDKLKWEEVLNESIQG